MSVSCPLVPVFILICRVMLRRFTLPPSPKRETVSTLGQLSVALIL